MKPGYWSSGAEKNMTEKKYESDMTKKEKRQKEWETIKSLPWKKRLDHIVTYYKLHIAVVLLIIFFGIVIGYMMHQSKYETILMVSVLNGAGGENISMAEDFKKYLGDKDPYHTVNVDTSMFFTDKEGVDDYHATVKMDTLTAGQELDAMVATKGQYEKYAQRGMLFPVEEVLTQEQIQQYGEDVVPYGIRVDQCSKWKDFKFELDQEMYLVVFNYTEHLDVAKEYIRYIYGGEEDE